MENAVRTPGAAILRVPAVGLIGHIVLSDGRGGTVEAHSRLRGVIHGVVSGRRWDYGVLVPWMEYDMQDPLPYERPNHVVYRYTLPKMVGATVGKIQNALKDAGFDPLGIDNVFGPNTMKAVEAFQQANDLLVDGEVGRQTAAALGIDL